MMVRWEGRRGGGDGLENVLVCWQHPHPQQPCALVRHHFHLHVLPRRGLQPTCRRGHRRRAQSTAELALPKERRNSLRRTARADTFPTMVSLAHADTVLRIHCRNSPRQVFVRPRHLRCQTRCGGVTLREQSQVQKGDGCHGQGIGGGPPFLGDDSAPSPLFPPPYSRFPVATGPRSQAPQHPPWVRAALSCGPLLAV